MTLPYFPFTTPQFQMSMGLQALEPGAIIDVDAQHVAAELALKQHLLAQDSARYFRELTGSRAAQWDVVALVLPLLAWCHPQHFTLTLQFNGAWCWENQMLGETTVLRIGDDHAIPFAPLDWVGRQVQEDLLVLADDPERGYPLVAGSLCFPNDWSISQKLGLPILAIHEPVPGFAAHLGHSTSRLFDRLKLGHPVWRLNWAVKPTDRLNQIPDFAPESAAAAHALTVATVGSHCWLRLERQTLTRLPRSEAILFTVHTYQVPLAEVVADREHARLLAANLRTAPHDLLAYKGISSFLAPLLAYLDQAHQA